MRLVLFNIKENEKNHEVYFLEEKKQCQMIKSENKIIKKKKQYQPVLPSKTHDLCHLIRSTNCFTKQKIHET
jgi:hypothetical protein